MYDDLIVHVANKIQLELVWLPFLQQRNEGDTSQVSDDMMSKISVGFLTTTHPILFFLVVVSM